MSWLDRRVRLPAVGAGLAADWLGTYLTFAFVVMAFGGVGMGEAELQTLVASTPFLVAATAHGTLFTALGGYVAARLAPSEARLHALVVGGLSLLLAVAMRFPAPADPPLEVPGWVDAVGLGLALPAALAGGWWAERRAVAAPPER